MATKPVFYEFFAGGGMARLGLGDGWTCAFANDFDPVKAAAYRANFSDAAEHFHEGDVFALNAGQLPTADLAWASSPCQDFSLAGARKGLDGGRSSAFFGFLPAATLMLRTFTRPSADCLVASKRSSSLSFLMRSARVSTLRCWFRAPDLVLRLRWRLIGIGP